ncbi:ACP phosphodiesterase [Eisenibacter elegans]|jgi:acyl carrier protein phosphodiesterase|uniref:acyl carrier protein phosphodiesterase n=1 Tax=Eisenibacter elegans TaxID=997 RepID=UPI000401CE2F|nr:ACP phosphodiesterase [Eisenibacter elegans]
MNFLAHIFLSGTASEQLLIGNFIGDFVRGKQLQTYSPEVQAGVRLHRAIDSYTDHHPLVKQSAQRLKADYGKYAPVIVDVYYDHFLATHWHQYHPQQSLAQFAQSRYAIFQKHQALLPERVQYLLPYMISQDWLLNYQQLSAIDRALCRLAERATFDSGLERAIHNLEAEYSAFEQDFLTFFPDVQCFVSEQIALRAVVQ